MSNYTNYKGEEEDKIYIYHPYKQRYRITSYYGKRGGGFHHGVDFKKPNNTMLQAKVVYNVGSGIVDRIGYQKGGAGNFVVVKSNWYNAVDGKKCTIEYKYFHLSKVFVKTGKEVDTVTPIGLEGNTGHSFGSHLHFEIRIKTAFQWRGRSVNPLGSEVKLLDRSKIMD